MLYGFHAIEKGRSPTARLWNRIMITTLAVGLLSLAALADAGRAADRTSTGSLTPERKGTMLNAEQTQGQTGRVAHDDVLPHAKTETATFALG